MTYMFSLGSMIFAFRWAAVQSEFRSSVPRPLIHSGGSYNSNNNNNNRELTERFRNLKALFDLKKNIQCTNTHNYTNQ